MRLSDVCDSTFFEHLAMCFDPDEICRSFINTNANELANYMNMEFYYLPAMDRIPDDPYKVVGARYARSLERIAIALTKVYNPLHNVDVTETETNDGSDSHSYSGTDTTTLVNVFSKTDYSQTTNEALTSGSTFDNTNESQMKPLSKTHHDFSTTQSTQSNGKSTLGYGKELTMEYGREVEKTRKGNIGVMPTQNLLQLEYNTRLRMTLFDAIVRACVNTLGSGVWGDE